MFATPLASSVADNVTDGLAYQPFCAAGVTTAVLTGAARSILIVAECVDSTFPALSVDQYVTVCVPTVEIVNAPPYVCVEPPSTV